jgi:hypothetical protein
MITDKTTLNGTNTSFFTHFPKKSSGEKEEKKVQTETVPVNRERVQQITQFLGTLSLTRHRRSINDLPCSLLIRNVKGDLSKLSVKMQNILTEQGSKLEQLHLPTTVLTQARLRSIVLKFPELRSFSCAGLDDGALRELGGLKQLKCLILERCQNITNSGLQALKAFDITNLETLELYQAENITSGITHLASLVNLKTLIVLGSQPSTKDKAITDEHIMHLKSLVNLRDLQIGKCSLKNAEDTTVSLLVKLRKLQKLLLEDDKLPHAKVILKNEAVGKKTVVDFFIWMLLQVHHNLTDFNGIRAPKYDDRSFGEFVKDLDPHITNLSVTGMHKVTHTGVKQAFDKKKFTRLERIEFDSCYKFEAETLTVFHDALPTLQNITLHGMRVSKSIFVTSDSLSLNICSNPAKDFPGLLVTHVKLLQSTYTGDLPSGFCSSDKD